MEEITIRKELRPLTIDPEFRDLIPPLMDEERRMLGTASSPMAAKRR
jgi:hypothetical protein